MKNIVGDEELHQQCNECCSQMTEEKYELAVLELDKRFLARLPDIKAVIKSDLIIAV
eukprot:gene51958-69525_t